MIDTEERVAQVPRQRKRSASINFPKTREEAFQAIVNRERLRLTLEGYEGGSLLKEFTTYAGLGQKRTQEQADWLNEARLAMLDHLRRCLED